MTAHQKIRDWVLLLLRMTLRISIAQGRYACLHAASQT